MPIIVDKDKKRREIACSVKDLILAKGIKKLTITEIAKKAGIARGSVYDYFGTKEDIIFEIIMNEIDQLKVELSQANSLNVSSREKVLKFFEFSLSNEDKFCQEREFYKEYLTVALSSDTTTMTKFNQEFSDLSKELLLSIMRDGIKKGELKDDALTLVDSLLAMEKGFLVIQWTEHRDTKSEFKDFINRLFDYIEKD